MIHNLLSIRQFTANNSCAVEFDTSGLTVKDSVSGRPLLRCDNIKALYTLRLPSSTTSPSPLRQLPLLRHHLPPTGTVDLVIPAKMFWLSLVIVQLSLVLGLFLLHMRRFDLIRDLWTSPVLSISGFKYYLVVVDDFSHYSWTFSLRAKS
jgi:hypothetical protein